jgi:hypothetical protein
LTNLSDNFGNNTYNETVYKYDNPEYIRNPEVNLDMFWEDDPALVLGLAPGVKRGRLYPSSGQREPSTTHYQYTFDRNGCPTKVVRTYSYYDVTVTYTMTYQEAR